MLTHSDSDTIAFGKTLAKTLTKGSILAFHGDLGAGKTTLIKGIIHAITGVAETAVQSPTFMYMHSYASPVPVYHFDLYRLRHEEEFIHQGFLDFLEGDGICLIEWPSRIQQLLPKSTLHINLEYLGENARRIDVQNS